MSYQDMRLEKAMYHTPGKSFSEVLEELDPSENYRGTELEGLDSYQRQLKRFDIKVSGRGSDAVEKFFQSSDSAALFPEYVSRAVRAGMEEASRLGDIIATTTKIEGLDYRTITSVPGVEEKELKKLAEGAAIPQTVVKTQDKLVKLQKRGRMLVASYEALRFQRLDLFTVTLRQIGAYIAASRFQDAVNVILSGDGNDSGAETVSAETSGTLTYTDLLTLWNKLDPYELTAMVMSPATMTKLLNLSEFKTSQAGLGFQNTGRPATPLGAVVVKSSAVPDGKIIGLDKRCALEMVVASDVTMETDRLIDRQLERAAITSIAGFAKIFPEASKVLSI